jgi:hypothetical protein
MYRICSLLLLLAFLTLAQGKDPAKDKAPAPPPPPVDLDAKARLMQKMDEIIISVHFEDATLEQALEFLRKKSRELDKTSAPAGKKGVNIILRGPELPHESRINLDLKDVPFSEALRYVAELAQMVYRVEAQGVILADMHSYQGETHTRTFKVPPDFFSVGGGETSDAPADPFAPSAPKPNPSVGLIPRKSTKQILEAAGITFPEGSSASYNPLTGLLKITNTQPNLDLVEAYCESCCFLSPKVIAFHLTILEAPGDLIRQINADASKTADASKQLATLLDLAQKPDTSVHLAGSAFLETKSGIVATTEAVPEPRLSISSSKEKDHQPTGLRLKLEPTVQADGQTIELSLDLALSPSSSPGKDEPNLSAPSSDNTPPQPTADIPKIHLTSDLVIRSGCTKLIGIARPPGLQQKSDGTLWAVFITSDIRYVDNQPHQFARAIPSSSKPPKDLSSITFQIPAGLFESIMEPTPKPLRDWLIDQGVTFPQGASIDLQNNLLLVTNTEDNIGILSTLIAAAVQKADKTVAVTLHTVRLPPAFLPKLSQAAQASTDQSAEWKEVEAAAALGDAVFLESSFFETRSGTRSTHGSACERYFLDQTAPKDKNSPGISINGQTLGSSLEIEATLNVDGRIIDVDYDHKLHVTGDLPDEALPNDPNTQNLPLPAASFRTLKTHSHTTMQDGDTRLIALHQDIGPGHAAPIWATFLQCCTVPHFPKPRHALALTAPASPDPDSLETRTYHPPYEIIYELLSTSLLPSAAAPMGADPFGSPPEAFPKRQPTTNEVLEKLGLTFPKGSLSHFDSATSTLTVRNTPANHALIAAAIEKIIRASPCTITTHVLQGPGPLLRRLAAQASHKSDHHSELAELLAAVKTGTVLHLDTARLETKPGTRATVNQGSEHKSISELSLDDKAQPIFKKETRIIGLNIELEPTTSEDSPFVNLILSAEFHTAPPFEHREHLIAPQGHRLEFPLTDYFTSKLTTGITLPSGSARLLSLYKPTGKPEFDKEDILQAIFITCDILHP